jgi:YD repeat-containing protein
MGKYTADIQVQNIGNSTLPRQLVLQFPDLPIGVNIASPSGIDANGVPYLNLRNAIQAGGLSAGEISAPIQVAFDDPTQVQFGLNPVFTAGALDVAPTLNQLGTLTLRPGERLNLPLIANDPNGDPIVLSIESTNNLPTGQLNAAERTLTFNPRPDQIGSYTFTVVAKQGKLVSTQDVTLNVVADEVQTTRISGRVQTDNAVPIAGLVINVGTTTATTDSNGNFTVEVPTNLTTLKVGGNGGYGAITSQLTALLGHDLYTGANNQLIEAIYLPTLGTLTNIDPTQNQIITSASLPNSRVNIAANTAKDGAGNPYTGQLSLVEVPLNQAPITLPDTFNPDVLMTLQGDVSFSSPATVTLPNRAGYTAGTKLELWALSAATGTFAKVGEGQVSADGQTVTTISGGISGSTWMCFVPQAIAPIPQAENPYNPLPTLTSYQAATPINSEAGLQTGVVMETQELFNYQSLGVQRSIGLSYNSLHAHSKPIINFGYNGYIASGNGDRLVAKLKIQRGDFWIDLPSKEWTLPPINQERITGGIQVDLSGEKTGSYRYKLTIGIQKANGEFLYGQSTVLEGQVVHVNRQKSQFGSGWGLTGLQELVIKDVGTNVVTNGGTTTSSSSGAILWVDGDGSNLVYSPGTTVNGITSYSNSLGDFSKLEKLADGTYRRTLKDQTVYNFNESGKLTSIVDRNNNATTFTYNGDKISEIIDPVGQKTQFSGNTITSPDGRIVTLGIDAQGDLLQISHPDGTSNQWVYDNHLMRVVKDQNGNRGYDEYDELGRVKKAIRKDGSEVYIKPAQVLGVVLSTSSTTPTVNTVPEPTSTQVDGNGNVIQTTLDKFGQTTSVRDSIGKVSTIQRDLHGNEVKTTDGLGNITSYTYDERNNLTGITYGDIGDVTPVNIPPFNDSITAYTLPNSGRPTHVATGDLNKDGIMDVVTATTSGQITTFFGNGNGTFTQSQNFTLKNFGVILSTDTCTVKKLLVRDFNGDGNLDIVVGYNSYVVANNYDTSIVVAMQGSATGTFTNSSTRNIKYAITNQFNAFDRFSFDIADVALGDLNGDGKLDITASNALGATPNLYGNGTTNPSLVVHLSQSNGTYAKTALRNLNLGINTKLAVGDFSGDGKQDLAVVTAASNNSSSTLSVFTSNGNGTFSAGTGYSIPGINGAPKVADLNGDGKLDVVVNTSRLQVFIGQGGSSFQLTTNEQLGDNLVEIGDIDRDGKLDIVTANASGQLRVFTGKGDGTFTSAPNFYPINLSPRGLSLADVNRDGKLDVVIADLNAGLNIKLNQSIDAPPPPVNTQKTFTYDSKFNLVTSITDELGRKTLYEIDSNNGNRLSETRVVGAVGGDDDVVIRYSYNSRGQVLTMTDGRGFTTSYEYNHPLGQLSAMLAADGTRTSYDYDGAGNRKSVIDANGHQTDYEYNNMNRLKKVLAPTTETGRSTTQYDYYDNGTVKSITDPNGNVSSYEYDALDRQTLIVDGEGNRTVSKYDKAGNLDYTIDGRGNKTRYEYDDRKRLVKVINPDGSYRDMTYDLANNLKTIRDENQRTIRKNSEVLNVKMYTS